VSLYLVECSLGCIRFCICGQVQVLFFFLFCCLRTLSSILEPNWFSGSSQAYSTSLSKPNSSHAPACLYLATRWPCIKGRVRFCWRCLRRGFTSGPEQEHWRPSFIYLPSFQIVTECVIRNCFLGALLRWIPIFWSCLRARVEKSI